MHRLLAHFAVLGCLVACSQPAGSTSHDLSFDDVRVNGQRFDFVIRYSNEQCIDLLRNPATGKDTMQRCRAQLYESMEGERWSSSVALSPEQSVGSGAFEADAFETGTVPTSATTTASADFRTYHGYREWVASLIALGWGPILDTNYFSRWEANGNRIDSCQEYVFEKYYELSQFENRVAALDANDFRAQFEVAFGPRDNPASLGTRRLDTAAAVSRDGLATGFTMLSQEAEPISILDTDWHEIGGGLNFVPRLTHALREVAAIPMADVLEHRHRAPVVRDFRWHSNASAFLQRVQRRIPLVVEREGIRSIRRSGYLDEELNELDYLQQQLASLLERYDDAARNGDFAVNIPRHERFNTDEPELRALEQRNAESFVAPLVEEMADILGRLHAAGCLAPGITPCDWSPRRFSRDVSSLLTQAQEHDYQTCLATMERPTDLDCTFARGDCDDLSAIPRTETVGFCATNGRGTGITMSRAQCADLARDDEAVAWFEPTSVEGDYLRSARHLDEYLSDWPRVQLATAQLAMERAGSEIRLVEDLISPRTGQIQAPDFSRQGGHRLGDRDWFHAAYDWRVYARTTGLDNDARDYCAVRASAGAEFSAEVTVLGQRLTAIDADFAMTVDSPVEDDGTIRIFGVELLQEEELGTTFNLVAGPASFEQSFETNFMVGPIPMRLAAGFAGQVGVTANAEVNITPDDICALRGPALSLSAQGRPFASLDAFAEAGLDVFVAGVGVRGELTLINAALPFTADVTLRSGGLDDRPRLAIETRADSDLTLVDGSLRAYAKVGICPLCKVWRKTIFGWDGIEVDENLWRVDFEVAAPALMDVLRNQRL